jgi:(p)ppGpp synthase/HD superfamily hydrolase
MRLYEAIQLALNAHDKQLRKLDGDIYAAHPIEVGMILQGLDVSEDVVIAGILHDTVEDTSVTLKQIETQFGKQVSHLVKGCSEPDKNLPWKTRKEYMLDFVIHEADYDTQLIILADKLSNIRSVYRNLETMGDTLWDKFNAGYEDQKWYGLEMSKALKGLSGLAIYEEYCHYLKLVCG